MNAALPLAADLLFISALVKERTPGTPGRQASMGRRTSAVQHSCAPVIE